MFCPLCTAEFRDGFTECSDCHVPLVARLDDSSTRRVRLWKGDRQAKLDRILSALDEAGIPCHFEEIVNAITRVRVFGIPIGPQRSTFEYEVWIFGHDLEKARLAREPTEPFR